MLYSIVWVRTVLDRLLYARSVAQSFVRGDPIGQTDFVRQHVHLTAVLPKLRALNVKSAGFCSGALVKALLPVSAHGIVTGRVGQNTLRLKATFLSTIRNNQPVRTGRFWNTVSLCKNTSVDLLRGTKQSTTSITTKSTTVLKTSNFVPEITAQVLRLCVATVVRITSSFASFKTINAGG